MKNHIRNNCKLELVPPGCHQCNAAKVAIQNFKNHFLSGLAGVADGFPPSLWDCLLPQTEITLNLLCQPNATPTVSAYAHLNGPFDYNTMPLAPMGCAVQVHEKSDTRGTWAYHSVDGWYLSTSSDHYLTHMCHIKSTQSDRLSDMVHFKHKNITNPLLTHANKIMKAIADLANVLKCKPIVTAKQEQEIRDLQRLMENIHMPTPIPRVTEQQDKQALPRVQTEAILLRVQNKAISSRVPEATQVDGKRATRSTSHLPVATEQ